MFICTHCNDSINESNREFEIEDRLQQWQDWVAGLNSSPHKLLFEKSASDLRFTEGDNTVSKHRRVNAGKKQAPVSVRDIK
jgi:hypothetical protein